MTKCFPEERPQMIAAIVWLLPMWTQLRKCAAGDIVPSLTSLKKHGPELKFFVSIFGKLHKIKIWKRAKWQSSKFVRFFLTTISHTYQIIKPPWWAAMKRKKPRFNVSYLYRNPIYDIPIVKLNYRFTQSLLTFS